MRSRSEVTFATFALKVKQVSREVAAVVYVEGQRQWEFPAEHYGPGWTQLDVLIVDSAAPEDRARIVENVTIGLGRLGYGYVIRRELPATVVPEADRANAVAQLKAMGMELQPARGKLPESWVSTSRNSPTDVIRMADLIGDASGRRRHFEVLAQSDGKSGRSSH